MAAKPEDQSATPAKEASPPPGPDNHATDAGAATGKVLGAPDAPATAEPTPVAKHDDDSPTGTVAKLDDQPAASAKEASPRGPDNNATDAGATTGNAVRAPDAPATGEPTALAKRDDDDPKVTAAKPEDQLATPAKEASAPEPDKNAAEAGPQK